MSRSLVCKLLVFTLVISMFIPFHEVKANGKNIPITVTLDGKKLNFDVQPIMKDDRVLVPFRALFEAFGATVAFDQISKTITSSKNDQNIELQVDSKKAIVNGEQKGLDVPAMIIDGRTLVPLRFIGENYQGQVNWNGTSKVVTIVTANKQPDNEKPPINPVQVYLNHELLIFDNPAINLNNKVYVPLESFIRQMGQDAYYEQHDNAIYIDIDGSSLTVYVGEKYAQLNGVFMDTNDCPIVHNGIVYAPSRYMTDLFGGSVHVTPGSSDINMLINLTKLRSKYLEKEEAYIDKPINVPNATFSGNRRLMVSDNPETLNANTIMLENSTLWDDKVNSSEQKIDHRVYGWHVNQLGRKVKFGITIENLSQTNELEIVDIKGIDRRGQESWAHSDVGLPLAEAVLSDKLFPIQMNNSIVRSNETAVINEFSADNQYLVGFLKDFTVKRKSGTGNLSYIVRVVMTQVDEDLTNIKSSAVQSDRINFHPRGVWKSSQLVTQLPTYQAGSEEIAYSISNGVTDNLLSVEQSLSGEKENLVKNPGHYGATYKVKIPITNNTGETKTVRVRIGARGGDYNGAIKVNDDKVYMIPVLKAGSEAANVIDYPVEGKTGNIELEIMHSGGSALPIAIDLITLD